MLLFQKRKRSTPFRVPRRAPDLPDPPEHASPDQDAADRVLRLFELLGRRWAIRVLWEVQHGPIGFRALQERGGGISASVLARRLTELVAGGVLEQDAERRYALSADGRALARILAQLAEWAARGGHAVGDGESV